jgi:hypothetical protein
MKHLLEVAPRRKLASGWKMGKKDLARYAEDPEIKSFRFRTETTNWW